MIRTRNFRLAIGAMGASLSLSAGQAVASDSESDDNWWSDVTLSGYVEAGYTYNGAHPSDGLNFGHLFTDRADAVVLNQLSLTLERPLDPDKASEYQAGFKFQAMYGTDARYTHFLGEFDTITKDRAQFDIVEAYLNGHLPILTAGGVDVKIGQFVTMEGAEVITPAGNLFYSHSYIFNFGIPLKHTGLLTTTHLSPQIAVFLGVTTGVNTTFGMDGDNNGAPAFHGGIGLSLLNGGLSIAATTHIGPELPRTAVGVDPNSDLRYLNDITVIWKATERLTSTTDLNYIRDDGLKAEGWGVAQYFAYAINNWSTLGVRGEIWKDEDGAFVAVFPGTQDFVNVQKGLPATAIGYGPTTYYALTFGSNFKPPVGKGFDGLLIRPEVRWDWSSDTTPFDAGTKDHQFTASIDVILPF